MNEVSRGFDRPFVESRLKRSKEAIQIIKKLWRKKNKQKITDSSISQFWNNTDFVNFG